MQKDDSLLNDFLSYRTRLAGVVSRFVPPNEVEDIVQETYVRACQFHDENRKKSPRPLMMKIARNLAIDHIKRAESRLTSSLDDCVESSFEQWANSCDDPLRRVSSDEEFCRFCEAVRLLPLQCRRVFVLKKVYGHSQRDIASKLNLSENTVEKHVAKGMQFCVQHLMLQVEEKPETAGGSKTPSRRPWR